MNIELQLTGITPGGDAIGRHDGMVVFVPFGLPGETVEVEIVEKRRNFARGRITRLLHPSPDRTVPRCSHFGTCGGCQWQQIDYAAQVRFKTEIVREQLTRIGKFDTPPVLDCLPSPLPYGYRNHARLAVAPSGRLGYRATSSHAVVEIDECPILEKDLWSQIAQTKPEKKPKKLRFPPRTQAAEIEIRWQTATLQVGEYRYFVTPDSFFQANTLMAAKMVDLVLDALQLSDSEVVSALSVLDLYCGVGLFTLPIGQRVARIIGIESNPAAIADARKNLAALNQQRPGCADLIAASVAKGLQQAAVKTTRWDAIVLDPPRAGVDEGALQAILAVGAPVLIYVSCDPATLARDLRQLVNAGYHLLSAQPLDMFPQTHHVETVCVLRKP